MQAWLVLATLIIPTLYGLSAHSPSDLFAHPKFHVVLTEQPLLNATAKELLASSTHSRSERLHLLRTPSGQSFLCTVPIVQAEPEPIHEELDLLAREEERSKGLAKGVALIDQHMRNGNPCLYLRQGWFTYSFCYGTEIRQFHEIRLPGSVASSEDPHSDSYTLGLFPLPPPSLSPPKYGSGSPSLLKSGMATIATLGGDTLSSNTGEGGRFLSMKWEGGTLCDKTGMPRSVDVQFHCNTQSTDRIALIRETSICNYVLIIHTPRLCTLSLFLDGHENSQYESNEIQCRPVVSKFPQELPQDIDDISDPISIDQTVFEAPSQQVEELMIDLIVGTEDDAEIESPQILTFIVDAETGQIQLDSDVNDPSSKIKEDEAAVDDAVGGLKDLVKLMQESIQNALSETPAPSDEKADSPPKVPTKQVIGDYLRSNQKVIEDAIQQERSRVGGKSKKIMMRSKEQKLMAVKRAAIGASPRYKTLAKLFGKDWEETEKQEGRVRDEL